MVYRKTVFILSVSSGIGLELARRFLKDGCRVIGTYRKKKFVQGILSRPHCDLIPCDITRKADINRLVRKFKARHVRWQTFISAVGRLKPLSHFFKVNFDRWSRSVHVNSLDQLRVLHALYPFRQKKEIANVVFFAGSGTNSVVVNMSAYITAKIMLMKMCECLDAENEDLNVFILGPGWTKTKAHEQILKDKNTPRAKYLETQSFFKRNQGTDFQDIYDCIQWLCRQGKKITGGRNFSVVHDPWKGDDQQRLIEALLTDANMYKLRRFKNNLFAKEK